MASSWPSVAPVLTNFGKSTTSNAITPHAQAAGAINRALYPTSEFEAVSLKINPPRVVFDNAKHPKYTLLQVDSANRYGCLLEVVQLLTDLGLIIVKGFISSDGGWFVDEFHVTDGEGKKIVDEGLMALIQEALGARASSSSASLTTQLSQCIPGGAKGGRPPGPTPLFPAAVAPRSGAFLAEPLNTAAAVAGAKPAAPSVRIEMTGKDRPGLLSKVSTLLTEYHCNVVDAQIWTHNQHVACVVHVVPDDTPEVAGSAPAAQGRGGAPLLGVPAAPPAMGRVMELTCRLKQVMQGEEAPVVGEGGQGQGGDKVVAGVVSGGEEAIKARDSGAFAGLESGAVPFAGEGFLEGGGKLGSGDTGRLIAMAAAMAREGTPSPSASTGQSPTDSGGATAVWAVEDSNSLGTNSLGTLYAGTRAAQAGAQSTQGGGANFSSRGAWGITTCSTKLERRLHQLLAASEGLQEERGTDRALAKVGRAAPYGLGEPMQRASTAENLAGLSRPVGSCWLGKDLTGASLPENSVLGFDNIDQSVSGGSFSSSTSSMGSGAEPDPARARAGAGVVSRRSQPSVTVSFSVETGYCILTIRCKDRPRLLFDCVCTLTDMGYVVYHGTIDTEDDMAFQEYYTRRLHGSSSLEEGEQERIVRALEAAIERRRPAEEGICVEVSGKDRVGLLSDLTKAFHRHNLTVVSATVSTKGSNVVDNFVVAPTVPPAPPPLPPPTPPAALPGAGRSAQLSTSHPGRTKDGHKSHLVPGARSHATMEDAMTYQQQMRKAAAEGVKEAYVKRVVEEIRQELGDAAQFKVKPVLHSSPGSSHGGAGPPISNHGRSLSSSSGFNSIDWGALSDSSQDYGGKTGMSPLYRKQQPTFTQMFLQQSERLFSSFGFGNTQGL